MLQVCIMLVGLEVVEINTWKIDQNLLSLIIRNMGLVVTKPVFGDPDKLRFTPACLATETT